MRLLPSSSASSLVVRVCCVLCVGMQTLSLLQGPLTEPGLLQHVEQQTAAHQATAVMLTNYTKVGHGAEAVSVVIIPLVLIIFSMDVPQDKRMFRNRLRVVPLSDNHGQVRPLPLPSLFRALAISDSFPFTSSSSLVFRSRTCWGYSRRCRRRRPA